MEENFPSKGYQLTVYGSIIIDVLVTLNVSYEFIATIFELDTFRGSFNYIVTDNWILNAILALAACVIIRFPRIILCIFMHQRGCTSLRRTQLISWRLVGAVIMAIMAILTFLYVGGYGFLYAIIVLEICFTGALYFFGK